MSDAATADGVHRLVDMVVEEVSLVDRAANKHRFLIVKRDDAMDEETQKADGEIAVGDGSPLGAALAALESLSAIVELLGSLGEDTTDVRLAALAQQLRTTAEEILERTGFAEETTEETVVEARAKNTDEPKASTFEKDVAAAREALARLSELTSRPATAPVNDDLTKLAESFRQLSETVKEQQQRLGRVEKQFGLPNSAPPAERLSKAAPEEVGWPLDLNKPMDRGSVEKAVSFHDL